MKFINEKGIKVVSNFIDRYSAEFNASTNENTTIVFRSLPVNNQHNEPLRCYANIIEYSEEISNRLGMSEIEIYAMIAHEIGHIMDKINNRTDTIPREICGDSMACMIGLRKPMISALKKMIASNLYPNESEMMNGRIDVLEREI